MSTTANKVTNPMKVITGPDTRWSYANVWEPKSINGGAAKYSVSLIIPKSDTKTVAKIKAAIEAAYQEGQAKLKGNGRSVPPLAAIKNPGTYVFSNDGVAIYPAENAEETYRIHTVVKGDTLWDIAKAYLGNGSRYPEIKTLNNLKSNVIYSGWKLKIPN